MLLTLLVFTITDNSRSMIWDSVYTDTLFQMPILFAMWFALSCSGETMLTIMENLLPAVDIVGPDFMQNPQVLRQPIWHLAFVFPSAQVLFMSWLCTFL